MKNLYFLIALFLTVTGLSFSAAAQTPVHKQTKSNIILSNVDAIGVTFTNTSTAGDLIIVQITWDKQNRTVQSLTDSKGNLYHQIGTETSWGGSYRSALYYAYNISADASKITVTANLDHKTQNLLEIYVSEYSNILSTSDPLDQVKTTFGSGTAINTGNVTTTSPNELLYSIAIGESVHITAGAGFNVRSTDQDNVVEDLTGVAAGLRSASFTGGGNWIAQVASFKAVVTTLPVSLLSFDARTLSNKTVELDWATATEANSDHFEVERSQNGLDWTTAGRVDAAGNSNTTLNYSFVDENPYTGLGYYRLKQVDRDGKATIFKTVTVHIDEASIATVKVYPNPATSYLVVEGATQAVSIYSTTGQRMLVRIVPDGEMKTTVDLTSLPHGAYFVKAGEHSSLFYKQ
ncbi:T9SS type A sorting domain-containing protein [Puia sp.]|jgi:hypothetical protein|uniref:T9SS type A sorting domain-containing protein n=1 Tax=Puia sp. TaxID=2045100 RepID=UPI002F3FFD64